MNTSLKLGRTALLLAAFFLVQPAVSKEQVEVKADEQLVAMGFVYQGDLSYSERKARKLRPGAHSDRLRELGQLV